MKDFFSHARVYIFRGFIAIIPLFLCYLAVKLLYVLIDVRVIEFLSQFFAIRQVPGLGILLVLVSLYFLGLFASNFMGRQMFKLIDKITERIPFIKAIYGVGKQLSHSLSITDDDKKAFKKAVLVNINNTNFWSPGFVTGNIVDPNTKEEMTMVFVPTVPNPTTGFVFAVKKSEIFDPGWTIEEGLKVVVSAGIITPKK